MEAAGFVRKLKTGASCPPLRSSSTSNSSEEEASAANEVRENSLHEDAEAKDRGLPKAAAPLQPGLGRASQAGASVVLHNFAGELSAKPPHSILRLLLGCIGAKLSGR